jgi:hypothetical protein
MTGKMLQDAAVSLARTRGYLAAHFRPAPSRSGFITPFSYDSRGFPDLVLVGPKVVAVEVKGDGDSLRPDQVKWLEAFEKAGVETLVLTSKAWREGALDAIL